MLLKHTESYFIKYRNDPIHSEDDREYYQMDFKERRYQ